MLVSFSVSNFRSFAEEQTFSLVASTRLGNQHDSHCIQIPGSTERVLKVGVIYGANGAGKSNLFRALEYAKDIAINSRQDSSNAARKTFRFAEMQNRPSVFDIQFIAKDKLYRFGFSIDSERIIEEWLLAYNKGRESTIYERSTDNSGRVKIRAPGLRGSNEKLTALVTIGGPQNQSFLATVRATLEPEYFGDKLTTVIDWMAKGLTLVAPNSEPRWLAHHLGSSDKFRKFAGNFLRGSSTGVDDLTVERKELSKEELHALFPEDLVPKIQKISQEDDKAIIKLPNGNDVLIDKQDDGDHYYLVSIKAAHKHAKNQAMLDLLEESDGTRRLLHLMPALYHLKSGEASYFIDEIDRSMHPMLVYKFLSYFLTSCTDTPCQIIVTTHESHLLDLDLLRRDEIWFAEKDNNGATSLYSLTDFNVRQDLKIKKGYLEGRFGAVPFLGDIDRLTKP